MQQFKARKPILTFAITLLALFFCASMFIIILAIVDFKQLNAQI